MTLSINTVSVLSLTSIQVEFTSYVLVNSNITNVSNYSITDVDDSTVLSVKKVFVPTTSSQSTLSVILETNRPLEGHTYALVASNLQDTTGTTIDSTVVNYAPYKHKVDHMFQNIPNHFTRSHGSAFRAILQAVANQDDLIGGNIATPAVINPTGVIVEELQVLINGVPVTINGVPVVLTGVV